MSELPEKQVKRLRTLIQEAETNLAAAKELLISIVGDDGQVVTPKNPSDEVAGKVIEGVLDGQMMLSPDGKNYPIPANYASKSKLVEDDLMKLSVTHSNLDLNLQILLENALKNTATSLKSKNAYNAAEIIINNKNMSIKGDRVKIDTRSGAYISRVSD